MHKCDIVDQASMGHEVRNAGIESATGEMMIQLEFPEMYASCVEKRRRVNWGSGPLCERVCASQKVSPHALCRDPAGAGVSTDAADIDVASIVGFCTVCYKVLKQTCTSLKGQLQPNGKPFTTVITYALNPKAVTMGQLYGEYNSDTHEWLNFRTISKYLGYFQISLNVYVKTDGILPTLIRADIATADCDKRWYIFDGPVDPVWIENLNTVLDDNKKLCLASGEIMKLLPSQIMIFEVSDLRVASPATISRCGMVYMEPENLGLQPLIDCWIRSLPTTMKDYIEEIIELTTQLVLPGLKIVRQNLREIVRTVDSAIVQSYINLMNFRIRPMTGPDLISPWAAFAIVWGLGATCDYKSRCIFSDWLKKVQKDAKHKIPFPEEGLVFDYRLHDGGFIDQIEGQEPILPKWYKWLDGISSIRIKPETKYMDIIIPTMDNVRSATLIEYLLINETNVLCVGATGSGKTSTVSAKLSRNMPKKYICDFMTFSARTTADETQDLIDAKLDKRRRGIYGPPILKKQIFFIDDLNMPVLDTYGAQPPIELIRQFMDFSGWYDKTEIGSFRLIKDVTFVAAMGPPGGGRNPITARLLRHFHIIAFPEMENDAQYHIFKTILDSWLSNTPELYNLLDDVVNSTLKVFTIIRSEMLPIPDKSHYTFNLRDLSKVFQGILMADARKILIRKKLLLLWYHENIRVFSDRLINDEDKKWFDQLLRSMLKNKFNCDADDIIGEKPLFYGDFCDPAGEYEQIIDIEKMRRILLDVLNDYNDLTTSPMQIVLFEDAISHICRITRILRQPGGNALLLGMRRRSLTRLSSYIKEYNCYQIEISKTYTIRDWRDDIKNIILKAGLQDQPIVFLFSDMQIKNDSMLGDLNNILNSGDVPNMYQPDEIDKIYQAMRTPARETGLQINRSNLFSIYLKAVRSNLHTIITMSPIGDTFRARIRQFPALVNCCTIDWFCPWPDAALQMCIRDRIHAMYNYYFVNKKVAPKMAALAKAEEILTENEILLASVMTRLQEIQEDIENLQDQLKAEEAKKAELERQKKLCEEQITRALKLIVGLSDEQKRWTIMVNNIKISLKNAVGDILLSSEASILLVGAIAYLTPFTDIYRQNLLETWYDALGEDVPHTPGCNPILTLGNQIEIRNWHISGLPRDALSVENAVLCKPIGLFIAKMSDKDLLSTIENCVQFGKPCLIENISTELEASLDPILTRALFKHAGQPSIKIGENIMLSLVTIQERPDLEQERNAIIVSCAEMKQKLEAIEDKILYRLTVSEGSIIDDIDLIYTLEASKAKSEEIKMKMETAEFTQADIDLTRSLYMPVANRAQILFFCITDLQRIDIMYQYSLEWFVVMLNNSISNTEKSNNINKRIMDISKNFTFALFTNICRSLFEKHKLHFGFLVCSRILLDNGTIDPMEWQHFLTTTTPIQLYVAPFPQPWKTKLDDFEKLLVLKCLRPDKVTNAMQIYMTKYLGQQFVEPQTTKLLAIYKESSNTTPIIFILSPGSDPAAELYKFADKLKMEGKLHSISLGQGQELRAQAMLKKSAEMGTWLFFQKNAKVTNCHLVSSWMPKLEFLIETLSSENTHQNFRLWLTSAPSPDFPISILQNSSKMTVEPPRGIKANMLRAYLTQVMEMQEFLQPDHLKALSFKRLIFSLCMFHSILIERRKFGPLGFNISYDFTNGDLAICLSQLYMFLMEYDTLPFKILTYTAGHINYGGRITDDWDRRCVLTLLEDYYNVNVVSQDYQFDEQGIYHQHSFHKQIVTKYAFILNLKHATFSCTKLPAAASFNDYLEYIKGFPLNDDPSLFGMHSNADISYAQAEAYACLATLLNMQPRELGVVTASVEEVTSQITKDMLSTISEPFDLTAMQARYPILYEESFNTVLLQEAKRYNSLLEIVQSTLQDLLKALRGFVVMSEQLEMMATSLYNNKIPANWESKSYPSLKSLAGWFIDLKERIRFIREWQDQGIPPAFWLSGFYCPQAFLAGTLQNFARKHVVCVDTIDFSFKVLSSKPTQRPLDGCIIYGLFLKGCRWDGNYLVESLPKELFAVLFTCCPGMPPILLLPEVHHVIPLHGTYICPVYKTIERSGTLNYFERGKTEL
ncbi:Dynein heavy chain 1, axonemal [Temnothorax longispinosus]|uniref:Dynein heavy chain 1, axonemal n=1 Tax=Temnothorax longispinosus TaxID=300112 RepID=A0A4S2KAW4_9HYME|nr:Dynein heavy chain 1, axonemal [Temnothorax longispinosus]